MLAPLCFSLFILFLLIPLPRQVLPADAPAEIEEPQRPLVALTFDDGPRRATTEQLLDGLAQRGVPATFFLVGEMIPGNEDLVERMDAEGHQIGVHTYDHVRLTALNAADFYAQVDRTRSMIGDILGRQETFILRPPYGDVDAAVEKRSGSAVILWSVDPEDWKYKDAAKVTQHVVSQARDGDVILLHDIYPTSVQAALDIVDGLHRKGFLFVTVDEMARQRHVELTPGLVCREFYP